MKKLLIIFALVLLSLASRGLVFASADDDGGTNSCDGQGGSPICTNPQVTSTCGDRFRILTSSTFGTYVNIVPSCPVGQHGCMNDCTNPSPVCVPDAAPFIPSPSASAQSTSTSPGSSTITTTPSCNSVLVQWNGFDPTQCVSATSYNIYRREVDISGNPVSGPGGQYILIAPLVRSTAYVDSTVVPGKRYQYKVEAIAGSSVGISITDTVCQPSTQPKESNVNLIPTCPSVEPPASQQPAASITPSTPRPKYVCHTVNTPNTNTGNQLQLQTLKCEYVN